MRWQSEIFSWENLIAAAAGDLNMLANIFQVGMKIFSWLENFLTFEACFAFGTILEQMVLEIKKSKLACFRFNLVTLWILSCLFNTFVWCFIQWKKGLAAVSLNKAFDSVFHLFAHIPKLWTLGTARWTLWGIYFLLFSIFMVFLSLLNIDLALLANDFSTFFALLWIEWNFLTDKTREKLLGAKHFLFILVLIWVEVPLAFRTQKFLQVLIWDEKHFPI